MAVSRVCDGLLFLVRFLALQALAGARRSRPGTPLAVEWMKNLTGKKRKEKRFKKIRVEDYILERKKKEKNIRNLH